MQNLTRSDLTKASNPIVDEESPLNPLNRVILEGQQRKSDTWEYARATSPRYRFFGFALRNGIPKKYIRQIKDNEEE